MPDLGLHFWHSVVIGWALGPGIPLGVLFAALFTAAGYFDSSANRGAFLGLLLGSLFAISVGLVVAGVVICIFWRRTAYSVFADAPK